MEWFCNNFSDDFKTKPSATLSPDPCDVSLSLTRSVNYDLWFQNLCCVKSGVGRGKENDPNSRRNSDLMTFTIASLCPSLQPLFALICYAFEGHDDPGSGCEINWNIINKRKTGDYTIRVRQAALSCRNLMSILGRVSQKPWKLFGPAKPSALVYLYLKTERDTPVNLLSTFVHCCRSEWAWSERARQLSILQKITL